MITEFMASNSASLSDEDGETSDWIELHNAGDVPASLDGWFLTDDADQLDRWQLPDVVINPGAFLVVFASGKDRDDPARELHTSFRLSAGGEYVALVSPENAVVSEFAVGGGEYPQQFPDISYGSTVAGPRYFVDATPGAPNGKGFVGFLENVSANVDHGFYDAPFLLDLTTTDADAVIRYTTDGSSPTAANGTEFTEPMTIENTTVLRAAAFREGYLQGPTLTQSYIFPDNVLQQSEAFGTDGTGLPLYTPWGDASAEGGSVWLNSGDGQFAVRGQGTVAVAGRTLGDARTQAIKLGDLDADGDLDAFVANTGANKVWLNDSRGNYTDTGQTLGTAESRAADVGDVDGDGDLDAVVVNAGSNAVWINDGTGHFSQVAQDLGTNGTAVALGDLDGDGDLDAVIGSSAANKIWFNDGDGNFTDSGQSLAATISRAIDLGDVDGDGDLDAVLAEQGTNHLWLNNGSGVFVAAPQSLGDDSSFDVALEDVDQDGDSDAFVASFAGSRIWVNDGQGGFTDSGQLLENLALTGINLGTSTVRAAELGDVDGDGDLDALVANSEVNKIWLNDGAGNFADVANVLDLDSDDIVGQNTWAIALGDVNGDGTVDALLGNDGANQVWINLPQTKLAATPQQLGDAASRAVALGDLDGDGNLDALVGNNDGNVVWHNDGAAVFSTTGQVLGTGPSRGAALGDVDGDGDLDAVVAGLSANTVWLNDGQGALSVGGGNLGMDGHDIALGDLDGDGDLDAFLAHSGPNMVWTNDGHGAFIDTGQALGVSDSRGVDLGDVDGDGDLDALVGNDGINRVWINDGAGIFSPSGQALGPSDGLAVALGDLDGDGDLDAFVSMLTGNNAWVNKIWTNSGDGIYTEGRQNLGNSPSRHVALGDVDGDGDLDVFAANASANKLWLNRGNGSFTDSQQSIGAQSFAVAWGDLDDNGRLDALLVKSGANAVLLNEPSADFREPAGQQSIGSNLTRDVALGDLDGDGDPDGFLVGEDVANGVYVNRGGGNFAKTSQAIGDSSTRSFAVALGDTDSDGDLDAIVGNLSADTVWLNEPLARLAQTGQNLGTAETRRVALGDVDDDGDLDVMVANPGANKLWRNDGAGSFTEDVHQIGDADSRDVQLADLDADGDLDAVFANDSTNTIWFNDGSGVFLQGAAGPGSAGTRIALSDLDNDGDMDILVAGTGANSVWLNNGAGIFSSTGQDLGNAESHDVALGDVDGDGDVDALVGNTGANSVWFNNGTGTFTPADAAPGSDGFAVALEDLDEDGHLDAFIGGQAGSRVWFNDGTGLFSDSGQTLGTTTTRAVRIDDMDGDGDLDALVATAGANELWFNDGDGLFSVIPGQLQGSDGRDVAVGDVNGDGQLDAVFGNHGANQTWLGQREVRFTDSGQALGDTATRAVQLGDIDDDGDIDALTAGATGTTVWFNDGQSQFTSGGQRLGSGGGIALALGDVDGDGDLDAMVGSGSGNQLWLNDGVGVFTLAEQTLGMAGSHAVALAPLDGDGHVDLFAGNTGPKSVWLNGGTETAGIFSNSGQQIGTTAAWDIDLGDIDGDADLDVVIGEPAGNSLWLNDGHGHFTNSGQLFGGTRSVAVSLGDVDSDGDLDVLLGNQIQSVDWGIDPDVVNYPLPDDRFTTDDLKSVPSLSVVLPWEDMFGEGGQGIYIEGKSDPRGTSLELLQPDGSTGFQIDGSIQVQGNTSTRRWKVDKLSMRVKFTREFGPSVLDFPLLGDDAAEVFNTFVLDSVDNFGWLHATQATLAKYIQDQYVADLHNAMGGNSPHARFHHLYVNGLYWGMYYVHERPDSSFAASYFGGDDSQYDVLKHNADTVVDGTNEAYLAMLELARQDLSDDANYQAVADIVDVDDLIDYMLTNFYVANSDWGEDNWYVTFNRESPDGKWHFHSWDAEEVLTSVNDRSTALKNNTGAPTEVHQQLTANAEYRLLFADHVQRHFFNGGVLTPETAAAKYQDRMNEIDRAIVGESARWGDNRRDDPFTRQDWIETQQQLLDNFFPRRTEILLGQLRGLDLFPNVDAPGFNQHGGQVTGDFPISLNADEGTIYYTTDGSDPRLPGGQVAATAVAFSAPFELAQAATIKARTLHDGEWSALNTASFVVISDVPLRITEINFNPHDANPVGGLNESNIDNDEFEFLELANMGQDPVDLGGIQLVQRVVDGDTQGLRFDFASQTLDPGAHVVIAGNRDAFLSRYGSSDLLAQGSDPLGGEDGAYGGRLGNEGEQLTLLAADGAIIQQFAYGVGADWPDRAAGRGSSLEIIDPFGSYSDPANWRASSEFGGSPGAPGTGAVQTVIVNEVLAHSVAGDADQIELYNTTQDAVDVADWYLSPSDDDYFAFRISAPTEIPAGGYHALQQAEFGFDLDGIHGGRVWLIASGENGRPTRFVDTVAFGGSEPGVSLGRWPDGDAAAPLIPLSDPSPGESNGAPATRHAVVSEVHYHPAAPTAFSENFDSGAAEAFLPDVGQWSVVDQRYQALPSDAGSTDTVAFLPDVPTSGRMRVSATVQPRLGDGTDVNAVIVFDYRNPTDFKFAMVDVTLNYWRIGRRDADGWHYLADERSITRLRANRLVNASVEILGPLVMVKSNGLLQARYRFEEPVGLGHVGLGTNNGVASFDNVVVETLADPQDGEFVELYNPTQVSVPLDGWELSGAVHFNFANGTTLPPGGAVVVVGFDPAFDVLSDDFRAAHGIDASVSLVGPYTRRLSDDGESIDLRRPLGSPTEAPGVILVDRATYDNVAPWPVAADGQGESLHRTAVGAAGTTPESWNAKPPSPGAADFVRPGDLNGDGRIDMDDIEGLALALRAPALYEAIYGINPVVAGDTDLDGDLDFDDIAAFLDLMTVGSAHLPDDPPAEAHRFKTSIVSDDPADRPTSGDDWPAVSDRVLEMESDWHPQRVRRARTSTRSR